MHALLIVLTVLAAVLAAWGLSLGALFGYWVYKFLKEGDGHG